ncbi:flagellar basal body rod protein FlgB [Rhodanobacter sp. DHB23]|uniref:flagellar basal body rod protein FlgB n=1 Tax=Rhodanobacter sp. DHB23 TaxID=2775923 RepID=UPI0017844FDF|nr:flagellar basal body rod protein FlgB [Rhodanobacter sp. DHB23]MBD8871232.1 flagellar basal body rod protein FlgB [Rhodanobacter sp. DHB23]
MSTIPQDLFGIHTQAMDLWQRRAEVLANNLANADTPGYLARDIDFRKALAAAGNQAGGNLQLETTSAGQIGNAPAGGTALAYRVPTQPSMDGNTVDAQVEQADFAANSVHYQASLSFITAQIHMLRTAITGGQS